VQANQYGAGSLQDARLSGQPAAHSAASSGTRSPDRLLVGSCADDHHCAGILIHLFPRSGKSAGPVVAGDAGSTAGAQHGNQPSSSVLASGPRHACRERTKTITRMSLRQLISLSPTRLLLASNRLDQSGLTYLGVMFLIVLMGILMSAMAQQWTIILKRDREAELLFRGNRIKRAIEKFAADYQVKKLERDHALPYSLEELTKPTPYLPAVYKDPITGQPFDLMMNEKSIYGVRSRSTDKPLNRVAFKEATAYNEILFKADGALQQHCSHSRLNGPSRLDRGSFLPSAPSGFRSEGTGTGMRSGSDAC